MNIIQPAFSQSDEMKPERQRDIVIVLSDRSREIIRLFEELQQKRRQSTTTTQTRGSFARSKRPF
jgi:hypothetical protein